MNQRAADQRQLSGPTKRHPSDPKLRRAGGVQNAVTGIGRWRPRPWWYTSVMILPVRMPKLGYCARTASLIAGGSDSGSESRTALPVDTTPLTKIAANLIRNGPMRARPMPTRFCCLRPHHADLLRTPRGELEANVVLLPNH